MLSLWRCFYSFCACFEICTQIPVITYKIWTRFDSIFRKMISIVRLYCHSIPRPSVGPCDFVRMLWLPQVNLNSFYHFILKNFWNYIITYFEDFRLLTLFLRYFSLFGMQISGIYVTNAWFSKSLYILFTIEFNSLKWSLELWEDYTCVKHYLAFFYFMIFNCTLHSLISHYSCDVNSGHFQITQRQSVQTKIFKISYNIISKVGAL
jgi:hypothetical protein